MYKLSEYETKQALFGPYDPFDSPFLSTDESSSFTVICEKLSRVFNRWEKEVRYARTVAELSRLDAARLQDIGLGYDEIKQAARRAVEIHAKEMRAGG